VNNRILCAILMLCAPVAASRAQSYAGTAATMEPTMLVDKPTAGLLKRGSYMLSTNLFQEGGVIFGINVGLFEQFMFGISYGGTDVVGPKKIKLNPLPGVQLKMRISDETETSPAIAIGFDSQGKEPYLDADSLRRYTIKAVGIYGVLSKNYVFYGNLSLHGGLNYSSERTDGDKDVNIFLGFEKSLGKEVSVVGEYDFATNDNNRKVGQGKGYINLGLRWAAGKGLIIGMDLKDITKNQQTFTVGNRTIQIDYITTF
jgi:hypothetical protein